MGSDDGWLLSSDTSDSAYRSIASCASSAPVIRPRPPMMTPPASLPMWRSPNLRDCMDRGGREDHGRICKWAMVTVPGMDDMRRDRSGGNRDVHDVTTALVAERSARCRGCLHSSTRIRCGARSLHQPMRIAPLLVALSRFGHEFSRYFMPLQATGSCR